MAKISAEVLSQLEQAQAELTANLEAAGPMVEAPVAPQAAAEPLFGAAGSGQAQHVLLDHYFNSNVRRLWAFSGNAWRYQNVTGEEEQGVAQVAYLADRVDVWWDANNVITLMRCWKSF